MKKLNSEKAFDLLIKDVIEVEDDFYKSQNKWVWHCFYVGEAAGRIASRLGLDEDKAKTLGYIHDIGRKINHKRHVLEGYYYLQELGYEEESGICLSHSFVHNDLNLVAGGTIKTKRQAFFDQYFIEHPCTIYDNIVQLCDLFCLESGFSTIENRLLDIYKRKGIFSNTFDHFQSVLILKKSLEVVMDCSLYSLFPEISKSDLDNINNHHNELIKMLGAYKTNIKK